MAKKKKIIKKAKKKAAPRKPKKQAKKAKPAPKGSRTCSPRNARISAARSLARPGGGIRFLARRAPQDARTAGGAQSTTHHPHIRPSRSRNAHANQPQRGSLFRAGDSLTSS